MAGPIRCSSQVFRKTLSANTLRLRSTLEFTGKLPQNAITVVRVFTKTPFRAASTQRTVMSIQVAEQLKSELTDKFVIVDPSVAELRRFQGLTGRVKTVNMNCRALVEFNSAEDISWYDIAPDYLTVVDAPVEKPKAAAAPKAAPKKAPAAKKAGSTAGLSPLELARQQGAGGAAKKPAADSKLSPLEQARQQGAGGAKKEAEPAKAAGSDDKKLSPLELARQQGAAGAAKAAPAKEETTADTPEETAPAAAPAASGPLSTDDILALCRQQGPFKG